MLRTDVLPYNPVISGLTKRVNCCIVKAILCFFSTTFTSTGPFHNSLFFCLQFFQKFLCETLRAFLHVRLCTTLYCRASRYVIYYYCANILHKCSCRLAQNMSLRAEMHAFKDSCLLLCGRLH